MLDQKKASSALKTHDEILDLFQEIESIEKNIIEPEIIEETAIQPEEEIQNDEQIVIFKEIVDEPEKMDILKKLNFDFLKRHKKKKLDEPKIKKHFLTILKSKFGEIKDIESTELQGELEKTKDIITPIKSTFTLKKNGQGNLVGLNIKESRPKQEKKPLRDKLFKRGSGKKEATPVETDVKGIKGIPVKIKGIFSKIKSKMPGGDKGESKESKTSGISGKIKGIFSRKSK